MLTKFQSLHMSTNFHIREVHSKEQGNPFKIHVAIGIYFSGSRRVVDGLSIRTVAGGLGIYERLRTLNF